METDFQEAGSDKAAAAHSRRFPAGGGRGRSRGRAGGYGPFPENFIIGHEGEGFLSR
jgi:hypothetical protein